MTKLRLFITKIALLAVFSCPGYAEQIRPSAIQSEIPILKSIVDDLLQTYKTTAHRGPFLRQLKEYLELPRRAEDKFQSVIDFLKMSQNNRLWRDIGVEVIRTYVRRGNIRYASKAFGILKYVDYGNPAYAAMLSEFIANAEIAVSEFRSDDAAEAAKALAIAMFTDEDGRFDTDEGALRLEQFFLSYPDINYGDFASFGVFLVEQSILLLKTEYDYLVVAHQLQLHYSSSNALMIAKQRSTLQGITFERTSTWESIREEVSRLCRFMFKPVRN